MGKNLRLGLILLAITAATGLILGAVHGITLEPIRATQERQRQEAFRATLPGTQTFVPLQVPEGSAVREVQEGRTGGAVTGHVFTVAPKGYAGPVVFVVGISRDGVIRGIRILNQSETPGLGANAGEPAFSGQFEGKRAEPLTVVKTPPTNPQDIQAISGATITSRAIAGGVNDAVQTWKKHFAEGARP